MAGSGFGFSPYPQRPSVAPKDVGALLQQKVQVQADQTAVSKHPTISNNVLGLPLAAGNLLQKAHYDAWGHSADFDSRPQEGVMQEGDPIAPPNGMAQALASHDPSSYLPLSEPDKIGGDDKTPSSFNILARELVQRTQSIAPQGQQRSPGATFNDQQLHKLGLSPEEIALMRRAGAIK